MTSPAIEILMPTRNRAADLDRCLASLAAVDHPNWGLIIIDQSTNDESAAVVDRWRPKFRALTHVPMREKGISRARNAAIERSTAPLLCFIDDDCTVEPDWVTSWIEAFERRPEAELIFGRVTGCKYDPREGLLPVFEPPPRADMWTLRAMGAAMSFRRTLFDKIGRFDLCLGVGSGIYESGEDTDYRYRTLHQGLEVAVAREVSIVHHGVRFYGDGSARKLMRATAYARGATDMKLLRSGEKSAWKVIKFAVLSYWRAMRLPWPLAYYFWGMLSSFRFQLDAPRGVFKM